MPNDLRERVARYLIDDLDVDYGDWDYYGRRPSVLKQEAEKAADAILALMRADILAALGDDRNT
jgi:hypothetical protein